MAPLRLREVEKVEKAAKEVSKEDKEEERTVEARAIRAKVLPVLDVGSVDIFLRPAGRYARNAEDEEAASSSRRAGHSYILRCY